VETIYEFSGVLWEYRGEAPWVFITLEVADADEIHARSPQSGGFGSVKVKARMGETEWSTSIFPDKSSGSFLLPVKRSVRDEQNLVVGDVANVMLRIDHE
jgi:hypothetical protein